uniref:ABC transporter F family member 4-like n=1 Tax=Styela clava TaxID=7725 RepID=UPI00193A3A2B|nr:ABC transporter F family member 4-like [Styela clava]
MESLKSTKKPKDSFQTELSAAVKKRRGFNPHVEYTSESEDDYDDDEYDDDFEEEVSTHHSSLKLSPKYSHKSKQDDDWELPSYLKDDDDDDGYGDGGSMFLKQSTSKKQNKPLFDPLGLNKDSSMPNSGMISEDSESTNNDYADDPILALLNPKPKKEKQPKPAKRHGKNKEPDQSFLPTAGPKRSLSPQQSGMDFSGKNFGSSIGYQQERMKSPVADLSSPKGRKSPSREKVISPNRSAELKRSLEMQDQRSGLIEKRPGSRPKTPQSPMLSGKHSPELKGIITTMKSSDSQISLGESKKKKGSDKSESFVDFLLDPSQPKPAPRKKGSRTTSEGSQPSQSLSPKTIKKENKERKKSPDRLGSPDVLKKQRTLSGERERSKSPKHRSLSPGTDKRTLSSMPLPSLQPMAKPLSTRTINQNQGFQLQGDILPEPVPKVSRAEKEKSHSDADDLLALFNQAIKDEPVDFQAHAREKEKVKSPLDDIVQKTAEQKMHEVPRQRSSRLLIDNVIDNVAQHNDGSSSDHSSMSGKDDHEHRTPRKRSGRKSYRTPPANYQGLGSLTMLKELKKKDEKKDKDDLSQSVTSEDIRKKIYLEWLAKREEEKNIKRKQELKEKKEQEKKLKDEKEDKVKENMIVRKKWEEVKIMHRLDGGGSSN